MTAALAILARWWPQLALAALIVGGGWYLDHRGYRRAEAAHALADARAAAQTAALRRAMEQALADRLAAIDRNLADRIAGIEATQRTVVQPVIEREIRNDPRYTDPRCAVSDSVRDALDSARAGQPPAAAGEHR
jgi:hypothetical protein